MMMPLLLAACATTPPADKPVKPIVSMPPAELPAVPTQDELTLRSIVLLQDRLYRVAAPLLVNNADLCKAHARPLLGFSARNRYSYASAYQPAARKVLRLGDKLQVMDVLGGSGAAKAGVRSGDVLLSIDNTPFPEGEQAERQTAAVLAPLVNGRSAVSLTVQRNGRDAMLHVPLTYACAFGMELGNTDNVVAFSDGYRILVSRGMLQFAATDDELAYVLAREMAHNVLFPRKGPTAGAAVGSLIDNLTRVHPDLNMMNSTGAMTPMPQKLDVQADRLAVYLLARAGYNLDGIVPFSRRIAQPPAARYGYGVMHPVTPYRIAAMERAVKEIRAKQARGTTLLP